MDGGDQSYNFQNGSLRSATSEMVASIISSVALGNQRHLLRQDYRRYIVGAFADDPIRRSVTNMLR